MTLTRMRPVSNHPALRQRHPREECPAFLAFVRRRPCAACGAPAPSQAAHLRFTDAAHPEKRHVGVGEKPDDRWANPLCSECHLDAPDAQHKVGERKFWARVGVDPFANAERLWAQFCRRSNRSPEQRERVVRRAKRIKRRVPSKFHRPVRGGNRWPPKGARKLRRAP